MAYEILEHTGDLRMRVTDASKEKLFESALLGMMGFIGGRAAAAARPPIKRTLSIVSPDSTSLLVDFLSEALSLSHIHKEVYDKVSFSKFSETSLEAELEGQPADSFDEDIKAVTYHEADVKRCEAGEWSTNLVFDI